MRRAPLCCCLLPLLTAWLAPCAAQTVAEPDFAPAMVRPLSWGSDGRLAAIHPDDARLTIWSVAEPAAPLQLESIPCGTGPVAVAFASDGNHCWVVDNLGDAIHVVSLTRRQVVATLPVGDEPADIVFAGSRAFVSVLGERAVAVFDVASRARIGTVALAAEGPRSLVVAPDGRRVWAITHRSGNQTTTVPSKFALPPIQPTNRSLPPPPKVGVIVDARDPRWQSALGAPLRDDDVHEIDVATLTVTRRVAGVGTILFGAAARPGTEELWVANTEARNLVAFEPNLRGHFVDNRVTRVDWAAATPTARPIELNPGIDYRVLPNPSALRTALAQPTDLVFSPNGLTAWVVAFGTDRIARLDVATGAVTARVDLGTTNGAPDGASKHGPRSALHHPSSSILYVWNWFRGGLTVIDTTTATVVGDFEYGARADRPERRGRGFLFDAKLSGNGTASCASCHIDGEDDGLAWDLGDPGGAMATVFDPIKQQSWDLHPMKGPMVTQTLRGLKGTEPLHWRGDRADLAAFNPAFDALMGGTQLPAGDMTELANWVDTLTLPPNPNQEWDRSYGAQAAAGANVFQHFQFRPGQRCTNCHTLPLTSGLFLSPGSLFFEPQVFKVTPLRGSYRKTGRAPRNGYRTSGFGYLHDGTLESVSALVANPGVFGSLENDAVRKAQLQAFLLSVDTGTAPLVGTSVTVTSTNLTQPAIATALARMRTRSAAGDGEWVAVGRLRGVRWGGLYRSATDDFEVAHQPVTTPVSRSNLLAQLGAATGNSLTFSLVAPGSGRRYALDRDLDGRKNAVDEGDSFGTATAGCDASSPSVDTNGPARRDAPGFALIARGLDASARGSALILSLRRATTPWFGIVLNVDPSVAVVLPAPADARGVAAIRLPIPDDSKLAGKTLHAQTVFVSSCGPQNLAATNGVSFTIR